MRSFWLVVLIICVSSVSVVYGGGGVKYNNNGGSRVVVKKGERTWIVATDFGSVSTVNIGGSDDSGRDEYHLQFITLEDNALFLPVLLHAHVLFYVHSGSGILSWTDGEKSSKEMNKVSLQRGDLYALRSGTVFYLNSNSSSEPEISNLSITAAFTNPDEEQSWGPFVGPYSSINELVRGFDKSVLQAAFQVPEEVIEELTNATETAAIVHADQQQSKQRFWEKKMTFINAIFGFQRFSNQAADNKKKKKHTAPETFNFFKEAPDFENCYGWSKVVTKHDLKALHGSQIGVYMANLFKGSMIGPHWNPSATEVSVVLEGEGMVQVVCPSSLTNKDCKNTRVRVEEGDVFTVPKFHPSAQVSFNNGSLVLLGFSSTTSKKNRPQLLAGKGSVLQTLDESILGVSFNVSNMTVGQLFAAQNESFLLDCTSCAESMMEGEIERDIPEEGERKRTEGDEKQRQPAEGKEEQEEETRPEEQGGWDEGGRGEEEADEEMMERQREEEEAGKRWGNIKLKANKKDRRGKSRLG